MSAFFYAPDCLQADCFLIELTDDGKEGCGEKKFILIDGGDRNVRHFNLLNFLMKKHKVSAIDLLIVTHLHRDHLGVLDEVSSKIPVKKGQLVYSERNLEELTDDRIYSVEMRKDVKIYRKLLQNLREQGTEISFSFDEASSTSEISSFKFMNYELEKLYPVRNQDESAVVPLIPRIDSVQSYEYMRKWLNKDSSVWVLKNQNKNLMLLAGDSFEENIRNPEKADVLKISHHARNSDFATYFSARQIKKIKPEKIVLTTTIELLEAVKNDRKRNFIFDYEVLCPSLLGKEIALKLD